MPDPRHLLGLRGEAAAEGWLTLRGWRVLERRWRGGPAELDLVCVDPEGALVAVEVKLRSSGRAGSGPESLDRRRVARLRRSLAAYASTSGARAHALRVDLVTLARTPEAWRLVHHRAVDEW